MAEISKETRDVVYQIAKDMIFGGRGEDRWSRVHRKKTLYPYALKMIREYGLSRQQIDELARPFVDKISSGLLHWEAAEYATDLIILGGSQTLAERLIEKAAEIGRKHAVEKLAKYLERDVSEEEAFVVVMAEVRSASRGGGRRQHNHPFMEDREVNLLNWSKQYIKDPAKIIELEKAFRRRDHDWRTSLM